MACGCCSNNGTEDYGYVGGGLKWAVNMTCEGFDMNTDDWKIIVTRGTNTVEYTRDTAVCDDSGQTPQWYICLDTTELGSGKAIITFVAYVPDADFPGGIRTEVAEYDLINIHGLRTKADITYNGD